MTIGRHTAHADWRRGRIAAPLRAAPLIAGALAGVLAGRGTPAYAQASWAIVDTIRAGHLPPPGGIIQPVDLAVLPDGGFVVVDGALQRAERYDAGGGVVAGYGGAPGDAAAMVLPIGVAVDAARGRVYVSDSAAGKVLTFGLGGGLQAAWEGFTQPEAMTVGHDGRLYVYDRPKAALGVRKAVGTTEPDIPVQRALSFSSELPGGLATSGRGTLFFAAENPVAEGANVLYEFTANGDVVPPRTQLRWRIRDIAFDAAGEMLLLDWTNRRIVSRLDRQRGEIGREWPVAGHPVAMAARAADEAWLLYGASPEKAAAVAVFEGGREVRRMQLPRPASHWFGPPHRLQVDAAGRLWVVDELDRAVRLSADGRRGEVQFTLHGLQETAPIGDGSKVIVLRTRSSSSADAPDDLDAPPPGVRRVYYECYSVRAGADPGVELPRLNLSERETAITAPDITVIVASSPDAEGTGAWVLDVGQGRLERVVHLGPGSDGLRSGSPKSDLPSNGYRDVVAMGTGHAGLLFPATSQLVIVDLDFEVTDKILLDADSRLTRIARLRDGRLAALTINDEVAVFGANGHRQAIVPLPRPAGADNELATDIAAGPDGTVYVADRLDRAIYVLRAGTVSAPQPTLYLPWAGAGAVR